MTHPPYADDRLPYHLHPSRHLEPHETIVKFASLPDPQRVSGRGALVDLYLRLMCKRTPKQHENEDSENAARVVVSVGMAGQIGFEGFAGVAMVTWDEVNSVDSENKLLSLLDGKIAQAEAQAFRVRASQ